MGVLPDITLRQLAEGGMIQPFEPRMVREAETPRGLERVVSYGVSSYGYDARLDRHFKVFSDTHCAVMDPKHVPPEAFVDKEADVLVIPPHGYVLAKTVETFCIPGDVMVICLGKSTYARSGLLVNVTPLEPAWRGEVTLELANLLPIPTKVYAGEGICQFLFLRGEGHPETNYAQKGGKYQDQRGVTVAQT